MSAPNKHGLDYFPLWNPRWHTVNKFKLNDYIKRINAIRNSSSAFIKSGNVRKIIFKRDNNCCVNCGAKEDLTVDHIISVYKAAKNLDLLNILNTEDNLQTLCKSCNSRKSP